jgi:inosose dehydratase
MEDLKPMKLGLSSYSLYNAIKDGSMTILDCVRWVADNGGEHIEIVPLGFDLTDGSGLPEAIREEAQRVGIDISNYAIGANFADKSGDELRREIERVKSHVDIASRLGVKLMRHDVASRPIPEATLSRFIDDLPRLVEACREIADYAAPYGITTSIENHGYFVQGSDRTLTLVGRVSRDNFRTTLDIGNFLCLDEDPVVAVSKSVPYMSMLHLKDFYCRPASENPGDGWFQTAGGQYLRGAVVGHGDLKMRDILRIVKASGYDGYISIEFEGMEECRWASKTGMANALRIWQDV